MAFAVQVRFALFASFLDVRSALSAVSHSSLRSRACAGYFVAPALVPLPAQPTLSDREVHFQASFTSRLSPRWSRVALAARLVSWRMSTLSPICCHLCTLSSVLPALEIAHRVSCSCLNAFAVESDLNAKESDAASPAVAAAVISHRSFRRSMCARRVVCQCKACPTGTTCDTGKVKNKNEYWVRYLRSL